MNIMMKFDTKGITDVVDQLRPLVKKKRDELVKIVVAVRNKGDVDTSAGIASPDELQKRFRDQRTGRINRRALAHPYKVESAELRALQAKLFANVGWLAAGSRD